MEEKTEITKFNEITTSVPEVIKQNENSVTGAKNAGLALLQRIEEHGMSSELDVECNNYLVKVKKTVALMNDRRKPITAILDDVKKRFTGLEAELSPKSDLYTKIQNSRNDYAKQKLEEQKKREQEAARKKAIENEKVTVKQTIEIGLANHVIEYTRAEKNRLSEAFNSITLENHQAKQDLIAKASILYREEHFNTFQLSVSTAYLSTDEKKLIKGLVMQGKHAGYAEQFKAEMTEFKQSLLDKIPSKISELQAIAEAEMKDAAEVERLKEEQDKREKAEAEKRKQEEQEKQAEIERIANAKAEESKMQNLFENAVETVDPNEKVQERTGYEIIVNHQAGYLQIISHWFEMEGKNLPLDAIEKKSIKQMKAFCASHAHKTETKIESKYIKYEEVVKVRAKA